MLGCDSDFLAIEIIYCYNSKTQPDVNDPQVIVLKSIFHIRLFAFLHYICIISNGYTYRALGPCMYLQYSMAKA